MTLILGNLRTVATVLEPITVSGAQTFRPWPGLPGGKTRVWIDAQRGLESASRGLAPPDMLISRVTMRYVKGLRKRMRIQTPDGRVLEILSIVNIDNRNHEYDLVCREVVS